MLYKPYHYQQEAERFILEREAAALLLDMGMGKSVITLSAIDKLLLLGDAEKVLIIAPLRPARETWPQEIAKWDHLADLTCSLILGSAKEREEALAKTADIYIVNRENVAWLADLYGRRWPFDTVVIDELSSFKSASALRFRALRRVRRQIRRVIGLTGTPAPNGLLDLWPQMFLLDGGASLGRTLSSYRQEFFLPDRYGPGGVVYSWRLKDGAEEAIYDRLRPTCLSMRSGDYLQLPERIYVDRYVELPDEAKGSYAALERDMLLPFAEGDVEAGSAAVLAGKLLQAAGGAVYDEHGAPRELHRAKLEALADLVEEANGQPVLIFYGYRHEAERIRALFPEAADIREKDAVSRWNRGEIPILLAHPAAAGHGLNLQDGGHIIIWYTPTWSLELYAQANKRLHRMGQKAPVIIFHLLAAGTLDRHVLEAAAVKKDATQQALITALTARIAEGAKNGLLA